MKEVKLKKYRGSLLLKIAVVCVGFFFAFFITTQQLQIVEKKNELDKIRTTMQAQQLRNDELRHSLEDDELDKKEYAERTARNDYNYAKPNERVYINIGGAE